MLLIENILDKITDKRVLMRVDFNVPTERMTFGRQITNNQRIINAIPSIKMILNAKPKALILCSHMGRPVDEFKIDYSLDIVAICLEKELNRKVIFK